MSAADWWRETHEALAAKVEAGQPLTLRDRKRAAAAIRRSAANPPGPAPRGRGRPAELPADDARMLFEALREDPKTWTVERAIAYVARTFDAPEPTVRDAVYKRTTKGA